MARQLELNVAKRELTTKGALNQLRNAGEIPCVIYGKGVDVVGAVNRKEFMTLAMGSLDEHIVFELKVAGSKKALHAVMKTRQFDPLKQEISHIDFQVIDLKEPIRLFSEFKIEGVAAGVKKGGIMEVRSTKVKGSALPLEYPKFIKCDISKMEIGDVLRVKDLDIPASLTLDVDSEFSILAIALPKSQRGNAAGTEEAAKAE